MAEFRIDLMSVASLVMASSRMVDPLDETVKELKKHTGKREKTDETWHTIGRLEFHGFMYYLHDVGPYLPADNIRKTLIDGAKRFRKGSTLNSAFFVTTPINPLVYKGPKDADELYRDPNYKLRVPARVQMNRTMRVRPIFRKWACSAEGVFDPTVVSLEDIQKFADAAGQYVGVGDWRPVYGRFRATVEQTG